jgi:predicted small secreted protein
MAVLVGLVSSGKLVSRGRMAGVFEAHDRLLVRLVAISVLASACNRVRGFVERLRRGARRAAHLS